MSPSTRLGAGPATAWARLLPSRLVVGVARLGPLGRRLPAPGTWGSLAGLLYYLVFFAPMRGFVGPVALGLAGLYLAVCFCGEAEVRLGRRDPGEIILDEFTAMPLCFIGWPYLIPAAPAWAILLGGFAFFRLFDIWKPLGIRRLQSLPGGWGVVADDVAAALAACGALHVSLALWHHFS